MPLKKKLALHKTRDSVHAGGFPAQVARWKRCGSSTRKRQRVLKRKGLLACYNILYFTSMLYCHLLRTAHYLALRRLHCIVLHCTALCRAVLCYCYTSLCRTMLHGNLLCYPGAKASNADAIASANGIPRPNPHTYLRLCLRFCVLCYYSAKAVLSRLHRVLLFYPMQCHAIQHGTILCYAILYYTKPY